MARQSSAKASTPVRIWSGPRIITLFLMKKLVVFDRDGTLIKHVNYLCTYLRNLMVHYVAKIHKVF